MTKKQYHLWTIGCQMNEADSRRLAAELESMGYSPTTVAEDADLVVLNTCVVRQQAEDKIYGRLGSLQTVKANRPGMTIGLMGCMVGVKEAPSLRKRFPFVDVFMPPSDTTPLVRHLLQQTQFSEIAAEDELERAQRDTIQDAMGLLPIEQRGQAITAFVPIVLGCSHSCTFCIIPYRRGVERSRPEEEIVDEIRRLVSQGVREVTLLGQIVDRYGMDFSTPSSLASLLRRVNDIDGLERIRFLTSHPNWMTDELLDAVASLGKVCPHIELPVQAGNDEVLDNMRRGYTVSRYHELIDGVRARIADVAIHTDIIVGFPGESAAQFDETIALLEHVRFDKVHISEYSVRPKTVAARKMVDDVSCDEKKRRRDAVDALQKGIQEEKNRRYRGACVDVLVDQRQKDRWRGRTPQNRLVFFPDSRNLLGKTVRVKISWTGPYSFIGEPVDAATEAAV